MTRVSTSISLLPVVLVTAACLLLGIVIGISAGRLGRFPPDLPTATLAIRLVTSTPIPSGAQISILLLGVDMLASPRPQLEGCWVITFYADVPQYYFLGFSPAMVVTVPDSANARTLSEIYNIDQDISHGTTTTFTRDALKSISPGLSLSDYEVVFDRQMLTWVVDHLGGIPLRGEWVMGDMLMARYDAIPPDSPMDKLVFQGEVLEAILKTAQQKNWSDNSWRAYLDLGQQWEPDLQAFEALTKIVLPTTSEAEFHISLAPLTREQPISTPP